MFDPQKACPLTHIAQEVSASHALASRSDQSGRRRHHLRRVEALVGHADDAAAALRAVGASELAVAHHRSHARPAGLGGDGGGPASAAGMEPVLVLHRRGARHHAVLGSGDGLREPGRGGVPDHAAGRRGASRPALQPLLRAGPRHRRHVRGSPAAGPREPQPGVHRDVRRSVGRLGPAPGGEPAGHRGQGRLCDALPHDYRGHPRADRPVVPDRLHGTQGDPARLGRGVQAHIPGRAPPRGLRHVVPAREGQRPGAQAAHHRARRGADPAGL